MNFQQILMTVIALLFGIVTYFVKKTFEKMDKIGDDVSDMKPKLDILWKDRLAPSNSPRQLNIQGSQVLEMSGIKQIIDKNKDKLLAIVKDNNPNNPYDAELEIARVVMNLPVHCPDIVDSLKQGAFLVGADVDSVLFVGSIYLRNMIFKDLGFSLDDLDKPRE